MPDDRELWKQICRRDAQAFDTFYRENAPRLLGFLRQMVGDPQAAEDIMQEAFTKIWNRPNGFQPERGGLRAYLYGIARKSAAAWWRRQGPDDAAVDDSAGPCRSETISIVADALGQLPPDQRALLWLREVEGQSYSELAQALEIPVGTVRSRLFTAREALREIWQRTRHSPKEGA